MAHRELPIPPHFAPLKVDEVWKVPYEKRDEEAEQNRFCIPGFELFIGGRSGIGNWKP